MSRCCFFYYVEDEDVQHFTTMEPGELSVCHVIVGRDLDSEDGSDYMLFGEEWMNKAAGGDEIPRFSVIMHVAYRGAAELEQLQDRIAAERKLTPDDVVALYHPRLFDDRFEDALAAKAEQEE